MGVKEHLVGLGVVSHQHVGAAAGEFDEGNFQPPAQSANGQVLGARIKL